MAGAMTRKNYFRIILLLLFLRSSGEVFAVTDDADENIVEQFVTLFSLPQAEQSARLSSISNNWRSGYTPMAIEWRCARLPKTNSRLARDVCRRDRRD